MIITPDQRLRVFVSSTLHELAPEREPRLAELIASIQQAGQRSYRVFSDAAELGELVAGDLAVLLTERFIRPPELSGSPAAAPLPPAQLPRAVTSFVGRDAEVDELAAILTRPDVSLVTLTGPGGIGKTRLALEVARRVELAFPEGVVGDCPDVTVLVTSRRVLRLRGEWEHPVGPLALPPPELDDPEAARRSAAVRLFLDRMAAIRPGLELGTGELAAVAELTRRLDGVPLALELAAARMRLPGTGSRPRGRAGAPWIAPAPAAAR